MFESPSLLSFYFFFFLLSCLLFFLYEIYSYSDANQPGVKVLPRFIVESERALRGYELVKASSCPDVPIQKSCGRCTSSGLVVNSPDGRKSILSRQFHQKRSH